MSATDLRTAGWSETAAAELDDIAATAPVERDERGTITRGAPPASPARAGRPAIRDGTQVRVTLPPDLLAEAERLAGWDGKGAAASGIRIALEREMLRR